MDGDEATAPQVLRSRLQAEEELGRLTLGRRRRGSHSVYVCLAATATCAASCCDTAVRSCHGFLNRIWLVNCPRQIRDSSNNVVGSWRQNGDVMEIRHAVGRGLCMQCCCGLGCFFVVVGFALLAYDPGAFEGDSIALLPVAAGSWSAELPPAQCATHWDCELGGTCVENACEYSRKVVANGVCLVLGVAFMVFAGIMGGTRGGCKWQVNQLNTREETMSIGRRAWMCCSTGSRTYDVERTRVQAEMVKADGDYVS